MARAAATQDPAPIVGIWTSDSLVPLTPENYVQAKLAEFYFSRHSGE